MEIPVKFSDQSLCEALELSYCNLGVLAAAWRHTHTQGRGDTNGDCDDSIPAPRCGPNIEIIHFSSNIDCSEKTKENLKEEEAGFITKFQIYVYNRNLLTYLLSNRRQMKMYTNQHKSFKSF